LQPVIVAAILVQFPVLKKVKLRLGRWLLDQG
jgi:hypothetical protein